MSTSKQRLHSNAAKPKTKPKSLRIRPERFTGTSSEVALPEEPRINLDKPRAKPKR